MEAPADVLATELRSAGASAWTTKAITALKHVWGERGAEASALARDPVAAVLNVGKVIF